jgi:hypothetical protein
MNFQEATGSLNLEESINKTTNEELFYFIDFSKLRSVEDLITVMAAMGFGLSNKHFQFEQIKQFLDLDRPVRTH